jgi:hypothetical protein
MADDEAAASEPASVVPALPPLASSLVGAILKGDPATNAPAGAVRSREGASSAKLTPLSVFVCGFVVLGRAVAGGGSMYSRNGSDMLDRAVAGTPRAFRLRGGSMPSGSCMGVVDHALLSALEGRWR